MLVNEIEKRVYITGCLGFIGSYVTRLFLSENWRVYGVDKETYAAQLNNLVIFKRNKNFSYIKSDIKDLKFLYDCDYVINCAAESHVDNSINDSASFIESNILGVKNLLELIRLKNNTTKRPILLHFSTDEVFGDIEFGSHDENSLLKPSNPYSASKAAADMLIMGWGRTYDIPYVIVRPTNNYGIGQYPEKLIPLCIRNLRRSRKIRLHNNGTPVRNWLHASDTAEAILTIIEKGTINEIYNIDGGFEQSNFETVKKIIGAFLGISDCEQLIHKYIDYSYNRVGQDVRYALNDSKLRNLGWKPKKKFDEEILKIVHHYKVNFIW